MNRLDFISPRAEITTDYAPGDVAEVTQHDGSVLRLRKLPDGYDAGDRVAAMNYLHERQAAGEVVTGLLFVEQESMDLHAHLQTVAEPFNRLDEEALCPGAKTLAAINASLR